MSPSSKSSPAFHRPIWDRGEPIDDEVMRFTVGDDWLQDRRLVEVDIEGSLAHAAGLARAGLLEEDDLAAIRRGLVAGPVKVQLDGGVLEIDWDRSANQITMTGSASHAFDGQLSADLLHD